MFSENKTTELKREYVDDIKNTAIAFANCDGGTLYVGIENDGTVRTRTAPCSGSPTPSGTPCART